MSVGWNWRSHILRLTKWGVCVRDTDFNNQKALCCYIFCCQCNRRRLYEVLIWTSECFTQKYMPEHLCRACVHALTPPPPGKSFINNTPPLELFILQ